MKNSCVLLSVLLLVAVTGCLPRSTQPDTVMDREEASVVQSTQYPIKLDSLPFEIRSIAWSADSRLLAVMGGQEVRVYDVNAGTLLWSQTPGGHWHHGGLTFIDDDRLVGTGNMGTVVCWQATQGAIMWTSDAFGTAASLRHGTGKLVLVTMGGRIAHLAPHTGRFEAIVAGDEETEFWQWILSSDGTKVAGHSYDQEIRICDSADLRLIAAVRLRDTWGSVSLAAAFHPVEPLIAVNTLFGRTDLFDYTNGTEIFRIPLDEPKSMGFSGSFNKVRRPLAFTPDGRLLVAAVYPEGLRTIDLSTNKELPVREAWRTAHIVSLDIAADSSRIAFGDREKTLWIDLVDGRGRTTLPNNGRKE